jgi:hypothetical protein
MKHIKQDKFGYFDNSNLPQINVHFNNTINNKNEYLEFEKDWLKCYQENKDFFFVFNTSNVGYINPSYVYNLTLFIQDLKSKKFNHLLYSIIIVNNWYIKQLLFWVFQVQKPVSNVYIVENNINISELINDIQNNKIIKNEKIVIVYKD